MLGTFGLRNERLTLVETFSCKGAASFATGHVLVVDGGVALASI